MVEEREQRLQNAASAVDWSIECVRAGMLLNGLAVIAMLAIMSSGKHVHGLDPTVVRYSISSFVWGTSCAFGGAVMAYLAQRVSAAARASVRRWYFPGLNGAGAFFVLASFAMFAFGAQTAAEDLVPHSPIKASALAPQASASTPDQEPDWSVALQP